MGKTVLELAVDNAQNASNQANAKITELGGYTSKMFAALTDIQHQFDLIRNVPSDKQFIIADLKKTRVTWKQQVEKIEADYKNLMSAYKGSGAAGAGLGVGVAALGPTAAMGIATTFGVASTGTAISALSGAAATNAALAWLGGGALVAGGGGMAAGNALLAMAGPIGWGIAAVSIIASGFFYWRAKNEKNRLENVYTLISERDVKKYKTAIVEINERIKHITIEHKQIIQGIEKIKTFGYDYRRMTSEQQYALGTYVELMVSSTALLVNPILGLQPSYTEDDYVSFCNGHKYSGFLSSIYDEPRRKNKKAIIAIANLLYNVETDYDDREILSKSFKKNEEFLESLGYTKDNYPDLLLSIVDDALDYKYSHPAPKKTKTKTSQAKSNTSTEKVNQEASTTKEQRITYNDADIERVVTIIVAKASNMNTKAVHGFQNISTLGAHIETVSAQLENVFNITIPADYVRDMHTVNDAVRFVKQLL